MIDNGKRRLRLLVSGSHGLIGRHLVRSRIAQGDTVVPLLRPGAQGSGVQACPDGTFDPATLDGFDVVVHLAGEPVAAGRWTQARKRRIYESRVNGTRRLAEALAASGRPPHLFLCASGINVYGDSGDRVLEESAPAGQGFLADVCAGWESAAALVAPCSRVVLLRLGAVLTPEGGALQTMLPLVRAGLAGPVAGGKQYVSWITLRDTLRAIDHVIASPLLGGPINVVSPEPVTNRAFTQALAAAVGRPAKLRVPGWAVRLLLGQMATETVLASVRAVPSRLLDDGFHFADSQLARSLDAMSLRR